MKDTLIIITILITSFSQSISSQNYVDSISFFKKNGNNVFTSKTVSKSETASYLPSPQLKINKIKSNEFTSETTVSIYMEEYIDNEKIENDDNLLERSTYSSNDYFSAEIIADTANCEILTIYTMLPSLVRFRYRNVNKDHKFKSIPFNHKILNNSKNTPIIFLYEDDINNNMEKIIRKYTKNDSLFIQFDHSKKPFSEIKRYITIIYTTTSKK